MGEKGVMNTKDPEFQKRRELAMAEVQLLDRDVIHDNPEREQFFEAVYDRAEGDAAAIPWADLALIQASLRNVVLFSFSERCSR